VTRFWPGAGAVCCVLILCDLPPHAPHHAAAWLLHEQVGVALLELGALADALPLVKAVLLRFPDSVRAKRLQVRLAALVQHVAFNYMCVCVGGGGGGCAHCTWTGVLHQLCVPCSAHAQHMSPVLVATACRPPCPSSSLHITA
jgi:hypothetical protein